MAFKTKAEKRAYKIGFKKGNKNNQHFKSNDPLDRIPLNYQNNVLMGEDEYRGIHREMVNLFGRDNYDLVRKLSITAYKDLYGDRVLRDHYGVKRSK